MQELDPNVAYEYNLNDSTYPRGRDRVVPITNSCNRPYKTVTIDMYTNCMLCICDGWLPNPVGEITDFDKLEDIWNNPIAHNIQQSIQDKKFTWCAVEHCGIPYHDNYEPMYQLTFGIDDSCNLHCPSCRRESRMHIEGPLYEKKLNAVKHTVKLLEKFEPRIHIILACSGDPLASHIYRPLIQSYVSKPSQTFTLFTNGLLIKKQLEKVNIRQNITQYWISVDAGSAEVYHKIRLGGNWDILMENFEYLAANRGTSGVSLMYVVQQKNYKDIFNFLEMCKKYKFFGNFMTLDDWGTWNNTRVETPDAWTIIHGAFPDHNVLDTMHPEYAQCKEIILQAKKNYNCNISQRILSQLNLI
jgi:molybdenum cofactor biosynthesis enzyme MoaA